MLHDFKKISQKCVLDATYIEKIFYSIQYFLSTLNHIIWKKKKRLSKIDFFFFFLLQYSLFSYLDDPVRLFEHEPSPPNSLIKFVTDLYSTKNTSGLLYMNDEMVLLDIMIRQLADLSPGDKVSFCFLWKMRHSCESEANTSNS